MVTVVADEGVEYAACTKLAPRMLKGRQHSNISTHVIRHSRAGRIGPRASFGGRFLQGWLLDSHTLRPKVEGRRRSISSTSESVFAHSTSARSQSHCEHAGPDHIEGGRTKYFAEAIRSEE